MYSISNVPKLML
ncbi:hypothetical protein CFC21_073258, partial [Triticum aestivum]